MEMAWQQSKQLAAFALVHLLALAGCTTTSTQTASSPQNPAQNTSDAAVSLPVVAVDTNAKSALFVTNIGEINAADPNAAKPPIATQNYPDIWARLRAGFAMKPLDGEQVDREIQWFVNNPE